MKIVTINNKPVEVKPIDFQAICELEDLGFDINSLSKKSFTTMRCAVAYNMNISLQEASTEIENHIKNGGKLDDLVPFIEAILQSDFFTALAKETKNKN